MPLELEPLPLLRSRTFTVTIGIQVVKVTLKVTEKVMIVMMMIVYQDLDDSTDGEDVEEEAPLITTTRYGRSAGTWRLTKI